MLDFVFHYDYVMNTFNSKLLFTDTDNLVYEIKTKNVYEQCFKDKDLFDFSRYPKDSVYYDISNKKVLEKIKDELNGTKISEFIGLKSKMYPLISDDDKEVDKAKGINKKLKHIFRKLLLIEGFGTFFFQETHKKQKITNFLKNKLQKIFYSLVYGGLFLFCS